MFIVEVEFATNYYLFIFLQKGTSPSCSNQSYFNTPITTFHLVNTNFPGRLDHAAYKYHAVKLGIRALENTPNPVELHIWLMNQTVKSLLAQSSIKNKSMDEATLIVYAAAIRHCITGGSRNVFAWVF